MINFMTLPDARTRVLHLADVVNRHDFIDVVVRNADRDRFWLGVCTFSERSSIESPRYADDGIPHWVIPARSRKGYPIAALRLARLLRSHRIDVVHTHHYDPTVVGWMATRLQRPTRLVVGRHYSDAIYLNATGLRRRGLLAIEGLVNRASSAIVVPTTMTRDVVLGQRVDRAKVEVIPYAFDPVRFEEPPAEALADARQVIGSDADFVVGTFARLYRDKGHRYLAEAIARLPAATRDGFRWVVVGDGPDRPVLERLVQDLGLDRVTMFVGWRTDALVLMAACDAVVQPTIQEAFSQVMVEALWLQRPLVISRVSGVDDLVVDGVSAIVVAPRNPDDLAAAIVRLREDPELRRSMAEKGKRVVETTLTTDRVVPRYESVYRRVAGDRHASGEG
jgi:glycosyltransferase involved in cell wall biosynthesis